MYTQPNQNFDVEKTMTEQQIKYIKEPDFRICIVSNFLI